MIDASEYPNRVIGTRRLAPADVVDAAVVAVNLAESPLTWLARRGMLSELQLAAGERLRGDYVAAGLEARVTMRWEAVPQGKGERRGGAHGQVWGSIDARRRFDAAMEAAGPGLADVLWRVVCAGEGLAQAEKGLGWPVRAGKLVLGIALDRLVAYYDNRYGSKYA